MIVPAVIEMHWVMWRLAVLDSRHAGGNLTYPKQQPFRAEPFGYRPPGYREESLTRALVSGALPIDDQVAEMLGLVVADMRAGVYGVQRGAYAHDILLHYDLLTPDDPGSRDKGPRAHHTRFARGKDFAAGVVEGRLMSLTPQQLAQAVR